MIPHCKINTYTGETQDYSITDDVLSVHIKDALTSGIGTFNFSLPSMKGTINEGYVYTDIAVNDTVKIWLWDSEVESCPVNPLFVGKISKINAPLTVDSGYVRVFEGKSLGEVLKRRVKINKYWYATEADDIVGQIASDLSLGSGQIETDTTDVTLKVECETYFDILKKVSDYWYNADTQIKKDFYVDVNNNLVWKSRPLRTEGVESLSIGKNILNYNVLRDVEPVKNKIYVYGLDAKNYPSDMDSWTDYSSPSTHHWTYADALYPSTLTADSNNKKKGSRSVKNTLDGDEVCSAFQFDIHAETGAYVDCTTYQYGRFHCFMRCDQDCTGYAYSSNVVFVGSNGYSDIYWFKMEPSANKWMEIDIPVGTFEDWVTTGEFAVNWDEIEKVQFWFYHPTATSNTWVDNAYFGKKRYYSLAENGTSQSNYGIREYQIIDNTLNSDSDCQKRAETLLYQLKDTPIRVDLEVVGNNNILIGDRIPLTIPAEGLSASNFDVLSAEHNQISQGWKTKLSLVNSGNIRQLPIATSQEAILRNFEIQKDVARGVNIVK